MIHYCLDHSHLLTKLAALINAETNKEDEINMVEFMKKVKEEIMPGKFF